MNIDGNTRLFAVVGDPVSAVRSPAVFNAWFAQAGTNAVLVPMLVPAADLPAAMAGLKALRNLDGIVVTMPHKGAACAFADTLGPMARAVGALNTMRREPDGTWTGEMFDGRGFVAGLRGQGVEPAGRRVCLFGAGAAGSAIAAALAEAGVASLTLVDTDRPKATGVAARVGAAYPSLHLVVGEADAAAELVVNATPLGMRPGDPMPFDPAAWPSATVIADVITKPEFTPLLARAEATGHRIQSGRHMHEGQARLAAAFLGVAAPGDGA